MSRSYKKFPCIKDRCSLRQKKREQPKTYANRAVRHSGDIPNGSGYKKLYCSYDISDYRFLPEDNIYLRVVWNYNKRIRRKYGSFERYKNCVLRSYRSK